MKFKVIFLKKKYIFYVLLALIILLLFLVFLTTKHTAAVTTFSYIDNNYTIREDLNGDGNKDILYIKADNEKYYIQVNTQNKSLLLEPNRDLSTVGIRYAYWPMRISLVDVNRDKIPEIFVQASDKNKSIQHAFIWKNDTFNDFFYNSNNILGFINCHNNQTPQILSGNYKSGKMNFNSYIILNNQMKKLNLTFSDNFMGQNSICCLINYIISLPENDSNLPSNILSTTLSGDDIGIFGKLSSLKRNYSFQDAMFTDTKYNKDGEISEIKWILNFKGVSLTSSNDIKNYTLNIILVPVQEKNNDYLFKIISMKLN